MGLHIIIDGYNLIRQSPELAGLDRQDLQWGRDALVEWLRAYKKIKPHKITVVFDGAEVPSLYASRDQAGGILIRFSAAGQSADEVILQMVRQERERALVVTSDRAVMRAAEAAGAGVMASAEFEEKLVMARYFSVKGEDADSGATGWRPTTRKKGPDRRLPKRQRKARRQMEKL
ncbi:NYN domain-containing protein [Desulfosarcina sp. OttesenSCG-928-B08]|nr:NYN domain-containing protein [Desulfosarcina sp. OttesenSCG-928-B08]